MKRWNIDGIKLYYPTAYEAMVAWPEAKSISEIQDDDHLTYIDDILRKCEVIADYIRGSDHRTILKYNSPFGMCEIMLSKDETDGHYFDYARCRLHRKGRLTDPVLWDVTTPRDVRYRYFVSPTEYSVVSIGGKLKKPDVLRGAKPVATACFCKATCQLFISGWDLYIKHTDYFSPTYVHPEDIGTPLTYRMEKYGVGQKKSSFVYADDWRAVVLR